MHIIRHCRVFFLVFLSCQLFRPASIVQCQFVFPDETSANENETDLAKSILENGWDWNVEDVNETMDVNCTIVFYNGTNVTVCDNFTMPGNWTIRRRDRLKLFAALIPILIKVAVVLIKILKVVLHVARVIWRIGVAIAKTVGKYAFKAAKLAFRAGKVVGKYLLKNGRLVRAIEEGYELGMAAKEIYDPVMEYYKMQEESKRLAEEEQRLFQEDLENNREEWEEESGNEVPPDVGEEPEWEPQRKTSLIRYGDEKDKMPPWIVAVIVIFLVALIVAMPTFAFIITTRRKGKRETTKKTKKTTVRKSARLRKPTGGSSVMRSMKTARSIKTEKD